MKQNLKSIFTCWALLGTVATFAQQAEVQITEISIQKDHFRVGENFTMVEFWIFTDVNGFTGEFDEETTVLTSVTDENGADLLAQEQAYRESRPNSSHSEMIQFGGMGRDGFGAVVYVHGKPDAGSEVFRLQGQVGMVNMGDEETVHILEGLPVTEGDDGPEVETEIGTVQVDYEMKATVGETVYYQYGIAGKNPVIKATVVGGDYSEEYRGMGIGLGPASFVLKEIPETIDVEVTIRNRVVKVIPFDLEVTVGF